MGIDNDGIIINTHLFNLYNNDHISMMITHISKIKTKYLP